MTAQTERSHMPSLADFHDLDSDDLFEKCRAFDTFAAETERLGIYQSQYRVQLSGPLDHRIRVVDPFGGGERSMICFDSNSYLGLHLHPRVLGAVRRAIDRVGYGTPSAQVLGGTNRYLCELEETLAAFYGREDTVVFPSGYAANVGTLTALLRPGDVVVRDRFSHASIIDGCRWSGAKTVAHEHLDARDLERKLTHLRNPRRGALVVTDGVFSMHGSLARLPELREVASRHGARLMVDEAHSLGVIGRTGRGLEEHFGMPGSIDVLMGTFSKAPGSVGGYVCGERALVRYLRFFARSSMFTASLPAAICAGLTESIRVMQDEPELRERLWRNANRFWTALAEEGLSLGRLESPIVTVHVGRDDLVWAVGRELFDAGIKCSSVCYPAVPHGQSILRLTVNARHTDDELDEAVRALASVGARYGIRAAEAEQREVA